MKKLLFVCCVFSIVAFAKGEGFEKRKAFKVSQIEKRISILNSLKSCVSSASGKEDMKACGAKAKEARESVKGEGKSFKEQRKAARAARKAAKGN
jgi:hypothetical protein